MGIKVKAIERNVAFSKDEKDAKWMFVMQPELYGLLNQDKVITEAAKNCGMPKPVMVSAINAYGEVVKTWATEGHSVPIPGLGTMRFGVRANAVENVEEVKASLITTRRVIFTPSVAIKEELAKTPVSITCYDRNGKVLKQVTSDDNEEVEDPDAQNPSAGKDNNSSDTDKGDSGNSTAGGSTTGDGGTTLD